MSKKTALIIEASAELFFAAYFMLAFFATCAQHFLFSPEKGSFPVLIAVWPVLTIGCFVLYVRTRTKMKQLELETSNSPRQRKDARGSSEQAVRIPEVKP
ncbi:MAG: hypothetical protein WBE76_13435 [Terracidiphilus sp.]